MGIEESNSMADTFQLHSLKTRVTFFTLAIFVTGIWSLSFYASRMLREDMQRLLGEQQFSTVSFVSAQVNQELDERLQSLEKIAAEISSSLLGSPRALQTLLEQRPIFQRHFNAGTFVTRRDGVAIADVSPAAGRPGLNYMYRDHVVAAIKEGKPTISPPLIGRALRAPVFCMSAPIRDAQGNVIGVLVGVTDLSQPNFLDKITHYRYGKTGGYLLIAPQHNLIVTATDKSRSMKALPESGRNLMHDRYMQGYDGFGVAVNSLGIKELSAARHVPVAGWFMVTVLPTEEAFAPIGAMQRRMLMATIFLTVLVGGLTWLMTLRMLKRHLSPMLEASKTLNTLADTDQLPQPLPIPRPDEIGELIAGFNRLLEALAQRETALRKAQIFSNTLLDSLPGIFYLYSYPELCMVLYNRRHESHFGYAAGELAGRHVTEWYPPESRAAVLQAIDTVMEEGSGSLEATVLAKDGSLIPFCFTAISFESEGQRYLMGTGRDITERKKAEDALRSSEQKLKTILEISNSGILITLSDGTITFSNFRMSELFGYSAEEIVTINYSELVHPDQRTIGSARLLDLSAQKQIQITTDRLYQRKDGTTFWGYVSGRIMFGVEGTLSSILLTITDISAIKNSEHERRLLEEQFHHAQKLESLGVLAGGIAHDFNNILTVILGHCYMGRENLYSGLDYKAVFQQIEDATNRAADLCRQMLTYAGKSPLVQTRINLWLLVDQVVKMLQAAIKKNVTIEIGRKRVVKEINGDSGQLQQIIMNLIINAAEAIGDNQGTIRVALTRAVVEADTTEKDTFGTDILPGGYVCLEVSDTGCGMDEESRKRIFEPFYTTKFTGRGLGMSAIRGIVKAHDGILHLTSTPGVGTSFKVCFPVPEISDDATPVSAVSTPSGKVGGTVLLVDDEQIIRDMAEMLLEALGFSAVTASNGSEAVKMYRERDSEIDVVLLDLIMPVMGGVEAYHNLRTINPVLPIIICSGYGVESLSGAIDNDDHAGFVHKPYKPDELRDVIMRMKQGEW
jgi:PAS domain S-box-containing protein